jgi:hypothetical protein
MRGRREQNMTSNTDKQDHEPAAATPAATQAPTGSTEQPEFAHTEVQDFANTEVQEREQLDPQWWSESTDGRCSEDAALFAASQPAPLNVV